MLDQRPRCMQRKRALYLASKGFNTTAIDISQSGIDKLIAVAEENKLKIDAFVCDLRSYNYPVFFDLIISSGVLHLVSRDEWKRALNQMKSATNINGYHSIGIFTKTEPEPEDQRGLMVGLAEEGELFDCYQDWEILDKKTFAFEHQHPDGPKHRHSGNRILARKR